MIRKGRLIKTLRELIEIPSVTGNEDKISAYVKKELEELGIEPIVDEVGNVYAELGEGKKSLMFNAHFDTVPPEGYKGDPYKSVIRQNKIIGLGSSDCKAGLATMMEMARVWNPEKGKLVLAFTVCEESVLKNERYTKGSMYAAEKYKCDGCIVLEPTMYDGVPKISGGCRGRMILELKVLGKTTHSSRPKTGRNAIMESMKLIKHLQEHDLLTGHYFGEELPETLSIVGIKAGAKATNIIPGECDVVVDYRTLPGRTDVMSRIKKSIAESNVKTEVEIPYFSPGYFLDEKNPILTLLEGEVKQSFKKNPILMVALGRADAEYYARNGTPSVIYGPGENHQCHKPGEYTLITSLVRCTNSVYNFAQKFLD
jgi:succinyl-diaminopimelate desuccinylase